ncbi:DUF4177 domain-containing protein [Pseudooceanicola sediminis]|uniref:DUF4177 domain-containing protein n=1 Tax=Pseudooceanicola sediminis TaxID=2211117 RepID=A0A399J128_9RHOB|nr:DUF4177 domain-containing protein [Pseudooceanicola sediminis]KAA2316217.1 DUF4177 domain-containing protein [Puniceibacterium sp. HSS470]RII39128.1 DUF4177 domain-containing protein [Pseudooceanicola sediminis]|tara:strand:- start:41415 stop:41972 length:558 start_codon:yes stop_codon:yes gene_type:complete
MTQYEYKVVPAPTRGIKARGIKTPEGRFANALEEVLNDMAGRGWEYVRAETLPQEERQGLTGSSSSFRNLLVFRREGAGALTHQHPEPGDTAEAVARAQDDETQAPPVTAGPSVGPAQRSDAVQGNGPRLSGVLKSRAAQVMGRASDVAEGAATPAPGVGDAAPTETRRDDSPDDDDTGQTRKPD